ncbi:MAG: hypothetical protein [brine shrimp arlivirus 8]|nr:MAG: hypothetical protein [brine shrimp arlivirus 8]UNI74127.1 MAG: hypothetical protein [brine shrimp arlivirus 8]UNI74132.1 MAG: hypothetical protein [brine shrimp arlivirus 8]UNI74137.1 MAG: hypothetical protein [brine shrimp arlivirus 8]
MNIQPQQPMGSARLILTPPGRVIETVCILYSSLPEMISGNNLTATVVLGVSATLDLDIYHQGNKIAHISDIMSYVRTIATNHVSIPRQISVQHLAPLEFKTLKGSENIVSRE